MDAIFLDSKNNKRNFLYQYDKGQYLTIENFPYTSVPKVQYTIPQMDATTTGKATLSGTTLRSKIPDALLSMGRDITAYLYIEDEDSGYTVEVVFISVKQRKQPVDYKYATEFDVTEINGTIMGTNYGYSTVLQWADNNTSNEDRVGYFVTITEDGKITKATSLANAHGVTVAPTGFTTNCNVDKLDSAGELLPKYAYVCSSGCVSVLKPKNTSITDVCIPSSGGMATNSSNNVGFKVIDEIDSTHLLIFIDPSVSVLNTSLNTINASLSTHTNRTDNPHKVSKSQVGLGSVPNVSTNNQTPTYATASTLSNLVSGETLATAFGKISKAIADLIAHIANKSNPHGVTKSQVGLGNVPNVDTNDQAPTYTEASAISKLSSGEKLSTAFGKISKAITDLIAHLANKSNPHGVTKTQVGLSNCDNTSDANKPISTATQTALNKKASTTHASTHKTGGSDALSCEDIGAATQEDLKKLEEKVYSLEFGGGFVIIDRVTGYHYTLGMDDGKLVVILVNDNSTTE